jgi:hypothetical protein
VTCRVACIDWQHSSTRTRVSIRRCPSPTDGPSLTTPTPADSTTRATIATNPTREHVRLPLACVHDIRNIVFLLQQRGVRHRLLNRRPRRVQE